MLASSVGRVARHGLTAVKLGPTDTSLDLSFLGGPLDGRITFTRASTATYFDATGTLQTAATNAPRFDYDPVSHAPRGLLIEEARTNLIPNSGNLTGLTVSLGTLTQAAGIAPDGTNTLVRFAEDGTNGNHYLSFTGTGTASQPYALTIFAKAAQRQYLQLSLDDGAGNGTFATFDLTAGAISGAQTARGTGTNTGATIKLIGNGVYRCSVAGSVGASTTLRSAIFISDIASPPWAPVYTGNGSSSLLLWGMQTELGAIPTSYIPTAAAAVTRAIEVATMPLAAWFNTPSVGSAVVDAMLPQAAPGVAVQGLLLLDDGTAANRLAMRNSPTTNVSVAWVSANVGTAAPASPGNTTPGAPFKLGASYSANTLNSAVNGSAVTTGSGAAPVTLTTMRLGQNSSGLSLANGYIRRARYWPRTLSNTELQQATT